MQFLTILGSPRLHGNTATLLGWAEEQLQADGHRVERVNISSCKVRGCGECRGCWKEDVELCAVSDDANSIFRQMAEADMVLFASPVFCWGFPAQLKALIDRMYCLMDLAVPHPAAPRIHGKPLGLLLTAGGEEADNADLVIRGFERLVAHTKATDAGHVLVPHCIDPSGLGEAERQRVVAWTRALGEGRALGVTAR